MCKAFNRPVEIYLNNNVKIRIKVMTDGMQINFLKIKINKKFMQLFTLKQKKKKKNK